MSLENCLEFTRRQVNGCKYLVPNREIELENFFPPNGSEVYVCKLPLDCSDIELFRFVSTKGRVFDVRMMVTFSGLNRGFAFVRYYSPEEADEAIKDLPGKPIRLSPPWYVSIQKSTDHRRLLLVGMHLRNASGEIQNLFDSKFPGELANVVELQTERPVYLLEFVSHKVAAISKRLNTFPLEWGSRVQLMWQPNEDVEQRLRLKKEREMLRKVFQDGREMYLRHEGKSVSPMQTVHQPMNARTTYGQLPSRPLSPLAPPIAQATGASALMQSVCDAFPSTAQAPYDQPSSLLHPTQNVYGRAPSTSHADDYYTQQPSAMMFSPIKQSAYGVAPSTTRATYDQPSEMPFQPISYLGGPSIGQATYSQLPSTSPPTRDEESSLPCTSLTRPPAFAGLGCAEWKHSDDYSKDGSLLTKYRSNLEQFRSNSPTAYYPANASYKAPEASMSTRASAAFGYSDWSQKENVPANKPAPTASVSYFSEQEYSAAVGYDHAQTGFSSAKIRQQYLASEDDCSVFSMPDVKQTEPRQLSTIGGARLVLGRENTTSPPSPSKTLRF